VSKGTDKYIVGKVHRFDQKKEMFKRAVWDAKWQDVRKRAYASPRYPKGKDGYKLEDLAFFNAAWYIEDAFAAGTVIHNTGMYKWDTVPGYQSQVPRDVKLKVDDPQKVSRKIKKVARFFGASLVGISELDKRWIYSHSFNRDSGEHEELEIPEEFKYAIVLVFEMDYELVKMTPKWLCDATEGKGYSTMPFTAAMLAQFIRNLGYKAIPTGNDTALSIPLAIDAGLGELGRNGLLITEEFGPRVRIAKVLTDLPLAPDESCDFGVLKYCSRCEKCARYCPSQAIIYGERTDKPHNISNNSGELKWPIDAEKCLSFWARNEGSCMTCIRVCPFNKPSGWFHRLVRWLIKLNISWLDSFLVKMDDLFGYGKQANAGKYWN